MEELLPGDGPTCRLVDRNDTAERDRVLQGFPPELVSKTRAVLDWGRPDLQRGPHGTLVLLFTVDTDLVKQRWVVLAAADDVLVIGDPVEADALRDLLDRVRPRDADAAFRVVLLGLAKLVPRVMEGVEVGDHDPVGGFHLTRRGERKQLRQERDRLSTLRELFAAQSRELGELDEVEGHEHDQRHAVRRARNAFDAGSSTAGRLYAMAGDELSEESALVNERLTLVSTLFLPATLVTGLFGMNFGWLTDHIESMPAFIALGLLVPVLVSLATYVVVRRLGAA